MSDNKNISDLNNLPVKNRIPLGDTWSQGRYKVGGWSSNMPRYCFGSKLLFKLCLIIHASSSLHQSLFHPLDRLTLLWPSYACMLSRNPFLRSYMSNFFSTNSGPMSVLNVLMLLSIFSIMVFQFFKTPLLHPLCWWSHSKKSHLAGLLISKWIFTLFESYWKI